MSKFASAREMTSSKTPEVRAREIFEPHKFEFARVEGVDKVQVNFEGVEYISSEEIRGMSVWFKSVGLSNPTILISLSNIPRTAYRQLRMIRNHLTNRLEIASLYVPFFCDPCAEDATKLVDGDAIRSATNPLLALEPYPICPKCKEPMEPDLAPADHFFALILTKPK